LPIDDRMQSVLVWLGLADKEQSPDVAGEHLRSFVRKADAPLFCHLLGCLANDSKRSRAFLASSGKPVETPEGDAVQRLEQLLKRGDAGGQKSKTAKAGAHHRSEKEANHNARAGRSKVSAKKRH